MDGSGESGEGGEGGEGGDFCGEAPLPPSAHQTRSGREGESEREEKEERVESRDFPKPEIGEGSEVISPGASPPVPSSELLGLLYHTVAEE